MDHRVQKSLSERLKVLAPFGIGQTKPRHFRDMVRVAWENRDNLSYAWKVLSKGVCDGCALGVHGFRDWTIDGVHLCMTRLNLLRLNTVGPIDDHILDDVSKLNDKSNEDLRKLGRLAHPMLRMRGEKGFRRISWDDALSRIASRIKSSTPNRIAFYLTSRGVTNETYYVAQKMARFLGTNNIDNAARLCHSPSTGAMKSAIGYAASTCSYRDWFGTDVIVFFGSNPANDQPVAMKYLIAAKKQGTKIVLVNPYREPGMTRYWVPSDAASAMFGSDIADWWFPVAQGGDIALIWGVIKTMIERGWEDRSFITTNTSGFEDVERVAREMNWSAIEKQTGLSRASIEEFASIMNSANTGVLVWSMGITQHAFGGDAVQMILNLGLMKGFVGRKNCGLMPIRGHSGVQGGAEMGAYATAFPGGKTICPENAAELSAKYGFEVPHSRGLSAAEMVEAADRDELDLLYLAGGNFLRTLPQPDYVASAMAKVPLRVHQDIILTDQMLIEGEEVILLPAKTRYEQDGGGTETTTERRVIFSPEIPREVGEARAEWKIFLDIARAVDAERAGVLKCSTGDEIRKEIGDVIPSYSGIEHLKAGGDSFQYGGPRLCDGFKFNTPDGKAHFRAVALPKVDRAEDVFHCSTRRGKQFNTLIYAEVDPLTNAPRDAVLMNRDDAAKLHVVDGDYVELVNDVGRLRCKVQLAPIARGNLQVHWPEGNVIIRKGILDAVGEVPDYNAFVRVLRI